MADLEPKPLTIGIMEVKELIPTFNYHNWADYSEDDEPILSFVTNHAGKTDLKKAWHQGEGYSWAISLPSPSWTGNS